MGLKKERKKKCGFYSQFCGFRTFATSQAAKLPKVVPNF